MKLRKLLACIVITMPFLASAEAPTDRQMMFADTLQMGKPYSKDPHVIKFDGRYLMYFSLPPHSWNGTEGWRIGIAESHGYKKVLMANHGVLSIASNLGLACQRIVSAEKLAKELIMANLLGGVVNIPETEVIRLMERPLDL